MFEGECMEGLHAAQTWMIWAYFK